MSTQFQRGGMEQDCTQLAVLILCNDYTGCDEMGDYFATEADTMIKITIVETRLAFKKA